MFSAFEQADINLKETGAGRCLRPACARTGKNFSANEKFSLTRYHSGINYISKENQYE